jgi:hypothetical protein
MFFFVIVDCHFVAMSPLCTRYLPEFCSLFAFVFSLACVYLCSHLPCTFDGWFSILDFYLQGFSSSKLFNVKYILLEKKVAICSSHAL